MTTILGKAANCGTSSNIFQALTTGPSRVTKSMQLLFHASGGYTVRVNHITKIEKEVGLRALGQHCNCVSVSRYIG
jgi:hypothetical protein